MHIKLAAAAILFTLWGSSSYAACYDEVYVPETVSCSKDNRENFADFSNGGCSVIPAKIQQVEVACPASWIPVVSMTETHSQACARVGMAVGNVEGAVCQSREQSRGTMPALLDAKTEWRANCRYDSPCQTYGGRMGVASGKFYSCWSASQRRDYDPTDRLTHWACK